MCLGIGVCLPPVLGFLCSLARSSSPVLTALTLLQAGSASCTLRPPWRLDHQGQRATAKVGWQLPAALPAVLASLP